MSAQFLNQSTKNPSANVRLFDAIIDNSLNANDLEINQYLYKKSLVLNQTDGATYPVQANYQSNLTINTQTFTTPHSNNNTTTFIIDAYDCSAPTDVVNIAIQRYNGTTGNPIVTGRCLDNNQYSVKITNLHKSEDLNVSFRLSVELCYFK
jgi:FlaG/FlaF family flagellin (archaellin)